MQKSSTFRVRRRPMVGAKASSQAGRRNRRRRANNIVSGGGTAATSGGSRPVTTDLKTSLPVLGTRYQSRKLFYYDYLGTLGSSTGQLSTHYYRANDLYDPDATGTGHQPLGFDQIMLFWEQFAVYRAKITVTFSCNSPGAIRCGVYLNPDQTDPPTISELQENGYVSSCVVLAVQEAAGSNPFQTSAHSLKTVTLTCDNLKYFQLRRRDSYLASDKFIGTAAASPTEMVYFGIFGVPIDGRIAWSVLYDVYLEYDAIFQEPRKLASSFASIARKALVRHEASSAAPEGKEEKESHMKPKLPPIPKPPDVNRKTIPRPPIAVPSVVIPRVDPPVPWDEEFIDSNLAGVMSPLFIEP